MHGGRVAVDANCRRKGETGTADKNRRIVAARAGQGACGEVGRAGGWESNANANNRRHAANGTGRARERARQQKGLRGETVARAEERRGVVVRNTAQLQGRERRDGGDRIWLVAQP
jgi:hypothetical protein